MATSPPRPDPPSRLAVLAGPLVLALTLFTAIVCAGIAVLLLLESEREPGRWPYVLGGAAVVATVASAFAEGSWSARVTRTAELGNATRLFAVATVLLLVPIVILAAIEEEEPVVLEARGTAAACPEDQVPDVAFEDLAVGTEQRLVGSCLRWWGVLAPEATVLAAGETVLRGELATLVDRTASAAGAPLPEVPGVDGPDPASPDAGAIVRVATAGLLPPADPAAFPAGEPVLRAELSSAIARLHRHVAGSALPPAEGEPFSDLDDDTAGAEEIRAVAEAGIAVGSADGSFGPDAAVNRGQVAVILARTLDLWVSEGLAELPGVSPAYWPPFCT